MAPRSYPRPPPPTWPHVHPRSLLPIYPPPQQPSLPPLPSPPREPAFDAPYSLSTHLFPAAFLRTTRDVPVPAPPPPSAGKEERKAILLKTGQELRSMRRSSVTQGHPKVLWNCANRYVRVGLDPSKRGITLLFAHANGFPKEIWEPVLAELFSSSARLVDEVWSWEAVQHGDAALVNANALSGIYDWNDNARDILNFLIYYLPSTAASPPLPTHLPRLPSPESNYRKTYGFAHRTLVVVGHSFGGCTSTLAALTHPALFSALILVDPVIVKPRPAEEAAKDPHYETLILGALSRRDTWASRDEARALFSQSPFFRAWDPAALALYIECGLYAPNPAASATVRLKIPGIQEAVVFAETHTGLETWERVGALDEKVALWWVMPGREGAYQFGGAGTTPELVWRRPVNCSNVTVEGAGHLIPQEKPKELAREIGGFLRERYGAGGVRANL